MKNPTLLLLLFISTLVNAQPANQDCNIFINLPDTLNVAFGKKINATTTGTNKIKKINWSPGKNVSDSTILQPNALLGGPGSYYKLTIKSIIDTNLIQNGKFTSGNTDFTTTHFYKTSGPVNNNEYYITTNPQLINPLWPNMGDHTSGSGNMMAVDGSTNISNYFWSQTIPVKTNTYYSFSYFGALLYLPKSKIQVKINGSQVGGIDTLGPDTAKWAYYEREWYSGSATTANISLYDIDLTPYGNDFAIDDIAFNEMCITKDSIFVKGYTESVLTHNEKYGINVYPNPTNGIITISGTTASAITTLQIYNAVGTIVYQIPLKSNNKHINASIDIRNLPSGFYLLKTSDEKNVQTIRLLKQ